MLENALVLAVCAAVTVAAVRLLVIRGIGQVCGALAFSTKTQGQIIGYATSMPEFVVLVSSALAGVFGAGFWNIASSNIINCVLFASAVFAYRQGLELWSPRFVDEVVFGAISVAVPLALFGAGLKLSVGVSIGLLALFVAYKAIDRAANREPDTPPRARDRQGSVGQGLLMLTAGTSVVIAAGWFLGRSAGVLIQKMGTPSWLVGWILGFVTSIPEMTSFFEIYRLNKQQRRLALPHDTQEALDALVASNMCNLGLILPIGAIIYVLAR